MHLVICTVNEQAIKDAIEVAGTIDFTTGMVEDEDDVSKKRKHEEDEDDVFVSKKMRTRNFDPVFKMEDTGKEVLYIVRRGAKKKTTVVCVGDPETQTDGILVRFAGAIAGYHGVGYKASELAQESNTKILIISLAATTVALSHSERQKKMMALGVPEVIPQDFTRDRNPLVKAILEKTWVLMRDMSQSVIDAVAADCPLIQDLEAMIGTFPDESALGRRTKKRIEVGKEAIEYFGLRKEALKKIYDSYGGLSMPQRKRDMLYRLFAFLNHTSGIGNGEFAITISNFVYPDWLERAEQGEIPINTDLICALKGLSFVPTVQKTVYVDKVKHDSRIIVYYRGTAENMPPVEINELTIDSLIACTVQATVKITGFATDEKRSHWAIGFYFETNNGPIDMMIEEVGDPNIKNRGASVFGMETL